MKNIYKLSLKKYGFLTLSVGILSLATIFHVSGTTGFMGLMGYGSSGDYTSPSTSLSGSVNVLTGETLTGTTQLTLTQPIQYSNGSIVVVIPNSSQITSSLGNVFDATAITTYNISVLPIGLPSNEQDVGIIKFGIDGVKLNFTKPVKIQLPVSTTTSTVRIKAKHAGIDGYQTSAITDSMASNCFNGYATPSSNVIPVVGGIATFYTCSASEFVAVIDKTTVVSSSSSSGGGGGGGIYRDYCPSGDFSPSYYDRNCGTAPTTQTGSEITQVVKDVIKAMEQTTTSTIPNSTTNEKIRFKYIVEAKVQTVKYSGYDIKVVPGYDLSTSTAKLSKYIVNTSGLTNKEKVNYVNKINDFLVAKYTLELSETKQQILKNKVAKQTILLKNVMNKLSK